jgi:DNA primase
MDARTHQEDSMDNNSITSWAALVRELTPARLAAAFLASPAWPPLARQLDDARRQGADVDQVLRAALPTTLQRGLNLLDQVAIVQGRVRDLLAGDLSDRVIRDVDDHTPADHVPNEVPDPIGEYTTSRARVIELTAAAARFYAAQYAGSGAQRYLRTRLGADVDQAGYLLGYASDSWDSLTKHLRDTMHATDEELVDAGLARYTRRGTVIDLFRERLLFGIRDVEGQVVGFTGRAAPGADPETPKYLNTPATSAFTKGAVLFGLAEHAAALAGGAVPVRVEGPLDAIAITMAADGHAVGLAPMGTALTAAQAALIADRAVDGVVLTATDHDKAGKAAAAKDYNQYTAHGLDPRELVLINNIDDQPIKDPADAYRVDPATLRMALTMPDIAPSLAGAIIRDRLIADQAAIIEHAGARVAAAHLIAGIIDDLPDSCRASEAASAAAALAHLSHTTDAETDYLDIITGAHTEQLRQDQAIATSQQRLVVLTAQLDQPGVAPIDILEPILQERHHLEQLLAARYPDRDPAQLRADYFPPMTKPPPATVEHSAPPKTGAPIDDIMRRVRQRQATATAEPRHAVPVPAHDGPEL